MNDYFMKIYSVIQKFQLDLYLAHIRDCVETASFIKFNFKTYSKISDVMRYESEFQCVLGDDTWLEAKNGYISICVPKKKSDIYPASEILDSDFYKNHHGILKVALGETPDGGMVIGDLEKWINVLIAGVPKSGKSTILNLMINCFMRQDPRLLNLIIFDFKEVELKRYNGISHLLRPVITNVENAREEFPAIITEMMLRYRKLEKAGCRNIQQYNERFDKMPFIIVIIDELSTMMLDDEKDIFEKQLIRIASLGRAAGIHLIIATQKPNKDIVTPLIKGNIDTRISFKVASHWDSQVILDMTGAEKLRMNGDMLLRDEDGLERIQCCFITDDEIEKNLNRNQTKNTQQFGKIELHPEQKQLDYRNNDDAIEVEIIDSYEINEFDRLYNLAVKYVEENEECNQWQLRQHLNKGPEYVDKIIGKLKKEKIISDFKTGKVYKIREEVQ